MTPLAVVDASALAAVIFGEPGGSDIATRFEGFIRSSIDHLPMGAPLSRETGEDGPAKPGRVRADGVCAAAPPSSVAHSRDTFSR